VVIGGTSGIGKELALRFGRIGFSIVLIGKNKDKLEDVKQRILQDSKVKVIII
jgi:short-subunit dehydrogenase